MTSQQDPNLKKQFLEKQYKDSNIHVMLRVNYWLERWFDLEGTDIIVLKSFSGVAENIGINKGTLHKSLENFVLQGIIDINFKTRVIFKKSCKFTTLPIDINNRDKILSFSTYIYKDCKVVKMQLFHFDKNGGIEMQGKDAFLKNYQVQDKVQPEILDIFKVFEKLYTKKYQKKYRVSRIHKANITVARKIIDLCSDINRGEVEWLKTTPEKFIEFAFNFFYAMNQSNGCRPVYFSMLGSPKLIKLLINAHEWIEPENFGSVQIPRDILIESNRKQFMRTWRDLPEDVRKTMDKRVYCMNILKFKGLTDITVEDILN